MTWTAQLTYTAGGLTSDDIAALTDALGDGGIVYGSDTGRLQITLEVEAPTLQDAADTVLRMTAAATGLLKLTRLQALTTAEFVAEIEHPPAMNLDAIGVTEIAAELGVSRQRAGQLTDDPDFPEPVLHPASGRLYTRASVKAFHKHWTATKTPGAVALPARRCTIGHLNAEVMQPASRVTRAASWAMPERVVII